MSDEYNNLNNEGSNNSEYNYWKDQRSNDGSSNDETRNMGYNNYSNQYDPNSYKGPNKESSNNKKKPSKIKRAFLFVIKAIAFGLIAAIAFVIVSNVYFNFNLGSSNKNDLFINGREDKFTIEQTEVIENEIADTDVTKVVEMTMPSVVTITGTFSETYDFFGQQIDEEKQGGGSGIIIDQNDEELLIATNNHVVEGAKPIEVTFIDGETVQAIIKGTDSGADLAVIAVNISELSETTKNSIKIADILKDGDVVVGEKAVAIGNALGIGQSVTVGYVSAIDREINIGNTKMTLLQTDAAINPGNSGGALLNMQGEVIGINTVKFAADAVEGMGYAIPITRAMPILNELKSRDVIPESEQGHLGVSITDVTEDIAKMYGWPVGVYVIEVVEGGPADKAGTLPGDIIVGIDDIDITSTTQLIEKVTSYHAGTDVTIRLMRNQNGTYVEKEVEVTLGSNPNR